MAYPISIPHSDLKGKIRSFSNSLWQNRWSSLTNNAKLRSIRPNIFPWISSCHPNRRHDIIMTRLRIGHTYLTNSYLLKSGEEREVPKCEFCRCTLTVNHILAECNGFSRERYAHFLRKSLKEILEEGADTQNIIDFLKEVHLYNKI